MPYSTVKSCNLIYLFGFGFSLPRGNNTFGVPTQERGHKREVENSVNWIYMLGFGFSLPRGDNTFGVPTQEHGHKREVDLFDSIYRDSSKG